LSKSCFIVIYLTTFKRNTVLNLPDKIVLLKCYGWIIWC